MSALPPGAPDTVPDRLRTLRVAVVLDPASVATLPAEAPPGVNLHLQLVALDSLDTTLPFLRQADILVVEVPLARGDAVGAFARVVAEQSRPVIAAASHLRPSDVRALMRAGAVDVIALPLLAEELGEALDAARGVLGTRVQSAAKGKVISLLRAVGGAGATALACQMGCLWGTKQSTCLIDLDLQFGAVALYLDMQPPLGLLDLVDAGDRLDRTLFTTVAARHASGLHIIAAPAEMVPLETLTPTMVAQILTFAAQSFEVVLVDLPTAWTAWTLAALTHSDAACLVSTLSVPGLRQARRQLDVIETNGLGVPLRIVLNRVPKKVFRTIDLGDSERALRRKVDFTIADDFQVMSSAIDQGRALTGKSAITADLGRLIAGLTEVVAA